MLRLQRSNWLLLLRNNHRSFLIRSQVPASKHLGSVTFRRPLMIRRASGLSPTRSWLRNPPTKWASSLLLGLRLLVLYYCCCMTAASSSGHLTAATSTSIPRQELEGVPLPDTQTLDGRTFRRKGYGLRRFQWAGMQVRVYVAVRYEDNDNEDDQLFTFTFLRSFGEGRVRGAWSYQLSTSATATDYDGWPTDRDRFIQLFGAIDHMGTEQVLLRGNETIVFDQGIEKGCIEGKDFQQAFLSMWFGEKAVSEELKTGLLGQVCEDDTIESSDTIAA